VTREGRTGARVGAGTVSARYVGPLPDQWSSLWPALAFSCSRGLFRSRGVARSTWLLSTASAAVMVGGGGESTRLLGLWIFRRADDGGGVKLGHDGSVLLTPLYLRMARRARDVDPLPLVVIPLFPGEALRSSVLPVSNLTNLIVTDQLHVGVGGFLTHPRRAIEGGRTCRCRRDGLAIRVRGCGSPVCACSRLSTTALSIPTSAVTAAWRRSCDR